MDFDWGGVNEDGSRVARMYPSGEARREAPDSVAFI
jgi:hypothetical protein